MLSLYAAASRSYPDPLARFLKHTQSSTTLSSPSPYSESNKEKTYYFRKKLKIFNLLSQAKDQRTTKAMHSFTFNLPGRQKTQTLFILLYR